MILRDTRYFAVVLLLLQFVACSRQKPLPKIEYRGVHEQFCAAVADTIKSSKWGEECSRYAAVDDEIVKTAFTSEPACHELQLVDPPNADGDNDYTLSIWADNPNRAVTERDVQELVSGRWKVHHWLWTMSRKNRSYQGEASDPSALTSQICNVVTGKGGTTE
jgi:hypothetical protein